MSQGIILDGGSCGCAPTQSVPGGYKNHLYFSPGGCLALDACFDGLKYFGSARWDVTTSIKLNTLADNTELSVGGGNSITAQNETTCDMGILIGMDMGIDIEALGDNLIGIYMFSKYNGTTVSSVQAATVRGQGVPLMRNISTAGVNPHEPYVDSGASALVLAPGASVNISTRLQLNYRIGTPNVGDTLFSAGAATRVYGYIIP